MRNVTIIISAVILAFVANYIYAGRAELSTDGRKTKLETCAPTKKNITALTGYSQTINVTDANCWMVYVAADTKFRCMSTATKVGTQMTIPAGGWHTEVIANPNGTADYTYVNFSTASATGIFRSDKP